MSQKAEEEKSARGRNEAGLKEKNAN